MLDWPAIIAWFAIVFTGRHPRGIYDFNVGYLRMSTRVNSYYVLLTDAWPPFGGEEARDHPVRLGVASPLDEYSRLDLLPTDRRDPGPVDR